MNPRVTEVRPNDDHSLTLTFDNGEVRVFDVSPYLHKGLFQQLKDRSVFNSVRPFLGSVQWANGLDLCPDTLYLDSIAQTAALEELAQFWDTHDLTDFEDQLEVVAAPVFAPKAEAVMKIHLRRQEIAAVTRIARSRGLPRESLLREWVLEKLRE